MNLHRPSLGFAVIAALIVATALTALGVISQQALDYAFLCSVAWALFNAMRKASLGPLSAAVLAIGIAGSLVGLQVWQPSLHYMPYLVIAPANLAMAYYFARGLFPGCQPVLLQLIRAMGKGPDDDPGFRHFVVWQCALWGLMTFALIGGLDVDFLCRAEEPAIRARVRETLDTCLPGGGYCLGTGNSVANYIPLDNYLAMLDEGRKFGR